MVKIQPRLDFFDSRGALTVFHSLPAEDGLISEAPLYIEISVYRTGFSSVADTTVRNYLDQLTAALVVRQVQPWHENMSKRQVKSPKVYIADSGVFHTLLNLPEPADLEAHPKCGASWEGFVIDQVVRHLDARPGECYFWATHAGAELDLLIVRGRKRYGFEIKRTTAPKVTPSMRHALTDLKHWSCLINSRKHIVF